MKKNVLRPTSFLLLIAILVAAFGAAWQSTPARADDCEANSGDCSTPAPSLPVFPQPSAAVSVAAWDQGWYDQTGFHSPSITNYVTGNCCGSGEYRSFYVFDLSGLSGTAVGAILWIYNPASGYLSPDATENLDIWYVSTNYGDLVGGVGGLSAFNDIGSGTPYGGTTVSSMYNGYWVPVILNSNAISDINSAIGSGDLAFGGALSTLSGAEPEHVFGFSEFDMAQLQIFYNGSANLLLNPGFDSFGSAPKAWNYSVLNVPTSSLADCNYGINGCSLKLSASRSTSIVTQTISFNGVGGESFLFGLSSAASGVPAGGQYKVETALFNRFNRVAYTTYLNFIDGSHGWQGVIGQFNAPSAFTKIRYRIYFQKSVGTAWFDDAFIYNMP